jgi:hypothetical protein
MRRMLIGVAVAIALSQALIAGVRSTRISLPGVGTL